MLDSVEKLTAPQTLQSKNNLIAFAGNIKYANDKVIFALFNFGFIAVACGGEAHKFLSPTQPAVKPSSFTR